MLGRDNQRTAGAAAGSTGGFTLVGKLRGVTSKIDTVRCVMVKADCKHMLLAALVLVAALCCSLAFAQEETAALNGQITDRDGLAVTGVKVQALNAGTNVSYVANTNEIGRYNFPTLPVGRYTVTATKNGFQQAAKPGVELHVADVISLTFSLQVGSVAERVTVE